MASFVLPILSGLAGLFGGGQQKQTQQTQNTTQSGTQSQTGQSTATTTPNLSPLQQALIGMFTGGAADLYQQSQNLSPYTQQGLQTIGSQGNANRQTISNILASRGLSYSPAAATPLTMNAYNIGNQQSQFLAGIPLLQRQLQQQSLDELMKSFGVIPTGQTNTGSTSGTTTSNMTSNMTGTGTQSGNPMAGLFGGIGAALPLAFPGIFGGGLRNQLPNQQSYNMQPAP